MLQFADGESVALAAHLVDFFESGTDTRQRIPVRGECTAARRAGDDHGGTAFHSPQDALFVGSFPHPGAVTLSKEIEFVRTNFRRCFAAITVGVSSDHARLSTDVQIGPIGDNKEYVASFHIGRLCICRLRHRVTDGVAISGQFVSVPGFVASEDFWLLGPTRCRDQEADSNKKRSKQMLSKQVLHCDSFEFRMSAFVNSPIMLCKRLCRNHDKEALSLLVKSVFSPYCAIFDDGFQGWTALIT